jgi:lycopene beta-cyclase
MTYFGFLIRFVGIPLLMLAVLTWLDARRGLRLPPSLSQLPGGLLIAAHIVVAVLWTTPWDNYLVATGVWYYDPALVTGITLGWVPIEEYTFFVVQTALTGLWVLWLGRHLRPAPLPAPKRPRLNLIAAGVTAVIWLAAVVMFFTRWQPGTYLALAAGWLLFPVIPQMLLGADMLWHQRHVVLPGIFGPWLYLSAADFHCHRCRHLDDCPCAIHRRNDRRRAAHRGSHLLPAYQHADRVRDGALPEHR